MALQGRASLTREMSIKWLQLTGGVLLRRAFAQTAMDMTGRVLHARRVDEANHVALGVQKDEILEREIQEASPVRVHDEQALDNLTHHLSKKK